MPDPYYTDPQVTLHLGEMLDILPTLPDASVDAVVCDPPYGLADHHPTVIAQAIGAWLAGDRAHVPDGAGFMGNDWDRFVPPPAAWDECWRVLKPGGHLVAFAGARTADLMGLSIRLAGFDIRDSLHWIYGSGMPKGQNVGKAIDKAAGAVRQVVGRYAPPNGQAWHLTADVSVAGYESRFGKRSESLAVTAPATEMARQWDGWNTQLKPAHEPIILARKPLAGTVAATVLQYGTGALNVDGCRTAAGQDYADKCASVVGLASNRNGDAYGEWTGVREDSTHPAGRWPTNVLLTHQPLLDADGQPIGDACADGCVPGCPVADMDQQGGWSQSPTSTGRGAGGQHGAYSPIGAQGRVPAPGDSGGASRFFPVFRYEAKAPASERMRLADGTAHPTVKPLALMQWLVRLVSQPGGLVLDPFTGSGTTLAAAVAEGMKAIGTERHCPYADLTVARLSRPITLGLFGEDIA